MSQGFYIILQESQPWYWTLINSVVTSQWNKPARDAHREAAEDWFWETEDTFSGSSHDMELGNDSEQLERTA